MCWPAVGVRLTCGPTRGEFIEMRSLAQRRRPLRTSTLYNMLTPLPSFDALPIPQAVKKPTRKRKAPVRGPHHLTGKEAKKYFADKKVWVNLDLDINKLFIESQ